MCSAIIISSSNLPKHWRATHLLDMCLAILVSSPNLLKHWRATHKLDASGCLAIVISSSAKHLREQLTCWMHVQPFLSVVLIYSNTRKTDILDV